MSHCHRPLFTTSVAAELTGVHPQTLRLYERKGLVHPARSAGGTRRYSRRDVARVQRITELTGAGVNLAGVERILDLEERLGGATYADHPPDHAPDAVAEVAWPPVYERQPFVGSQRS